MLRVALFTDTYTPDVNGAALTLERWVNYLKDAGIPCIVFAPEGDRHEPRRPDIERFFSIPFIFYKECKLAIPNIRHINERLKEFGPTLIHVATPFNLGLYGASYASKNHLPLVASYHTHFDRYLNYYHLKWMTPTLWKYMLWFHRKCERIYVPSRSTLESLRARGFRSLEIWGRGMDTDQFHPGADRHEIWERWGVDAKQFIILYVGRLAPEKGIDLLLETYHHLPDPIRDHCHLVVAGAGPLYRTIASADADGRIRRITWTGFVQGDALQELYAAADVFLFPSATETFGNVVLEAMASGTAVIGASEGGVGDMIEHGRTGWLCPAGDREAFVDAVVKLYEDEELRRQLAEAGHEYSRQQSWDAIFGRLLDSYYEVIGLNQDQYHTNYK
ncbi:glycosyltransferase family 1 protein [Paenibacillus sp. JX-17]|uniref:Glycosyltransferase family 1 protein n=1 Tax=Paenibacillus lacisoli TaxID=3064525 RepID=A0ABT9C9L0_9BACL|nr:glycosyltransferase family 1 protein [Paenibacillus sp. JX-17]MDO7905939.1 glycosyltransferase family 1 protein [Paenibacillus sp. JX-17]